MNGESPQWGRFGRYSGKNSTHCEELTTEIFNWEKEYGYQQTISEISRVREVSLRKKRGKHRTLHNEFWTCELIFLGEDSGWIICEMIPDKWAGSTFRLWGKNPTITVWSDGLRFLSRKAPFLLLGILWRKRFLAKFPTSSIAIQAFISMIKTQPGLPITSANTGLCGSQRDTNLTFHLPKDSRLQNIFLCNSHLHPLREAERIAP